MSRQIDQWERTKSPDIDQSAYCILVYDEDNISNH